MLNTYNYTYNRELSNSEWKRLRDFCSIVVSKDVCAGFEEQHGRLFAIPDRRLPTRGMELHNMHNIRDGVVRDTKLGATVVAVLMGAQQSGRVIHWHSSGDVNDARPGIELYYDTCDEYAKAHGHQWWLPGPAVKVADVAAAFHVKWKQIAGDIELMAESAQALTALSSARGSYPLLRLLEELNEMLMEHFDLGSKPLSEDLEGVDTQGMLEKWRDEMFETVVHGRI